MSSGYTLLAEAVRTARKQHRCIWCGQAILTGTRYRDERSVYDGEMQHHRWHLECDEQFGIELAYEGSPMEFSPYENDRPDITAGAPAPASPPGSSTA